MSEQLKHGGGEQLKHIDTSETEKMNAEARKYNTEKSSHEHKENLGTITKKVEQHAISGKEHAKQGSEDGGNKNHHLVNTELKNMAFSRLLTRTQKHLSKPERLFSKAIHNPAVEKISEVSSKTIARPSGILGGSIIAFFGTTLFLYMAKHYGFEYNYLMFIMLFAGGFAIGMTLEFLMHFLKRSKNS